ncbi:MAG TPA: ATP-binding protein [Thermoanaerobaculia bacterium]|nr:ATP-binding protein [Thermoanaerobaculia bacterium]
MNGPAIGGQHIRLLMLEDNPLDAELTSRYLEREQLRFSLTVVDNEADFRTMLETTDPDVILSDFSMPGFDGMRALRIARVVAPEIPFVFLSGSIGEERAVEALREGAIDYVLKDRISRLASAVVRALTERRERTLRHNMERALRASEQRFQTAAAATREIIVDWDLATSHIWFSDAFREDWGYETAEIDAPATWFLERIHPEDRAAAQASFEEAIAKRERWYCEYRLARADGTYRSVIVRGMTMRDGEGRATRVIGAMLDVTERLQMREQLEQARRIESLGRVAATVAHEFNNVLMTILPFTEILQRSSDPRVLEQSARRISDAVARGRRLTDQILRFSKPAEPAFVMLDLGQWLERLIPELRSVVNGKVAVEVNAEDVRLPVLIDSAQMQQVLLNLMVNARDAMPHGGTIRVSTAAADRSAVLAVADDGTGIPADILEQIFEPLYTTKRSGTGLGLAVAQQIVVRHRGSIDATSVVGEGTSFRILLPFAEQ